MAAAQSMRQEYEFIATTNCCPICDALDGKHFKVKDLVAGENAPPMHPNCRCSAAPWVDEEDAIEESSVKSIENVRFSDRKSSASEGHNGIINILIDGFVPCLKSYKTGEIFETVVSEVRDKRLLSKFNEKNGWYINWNEVPDECTVRALRIKGQDEIQGLVAFKDLPDHKTVYLHWAVANPKSNKQKTSAPEYQGIGGHLFAIAVEESMKKGYGGFVEGRASCYKLLEHYKKTLDAVPLDGFRFFVDDEAARKLLKEYNWSVLDE